jgi:hypothetical protein
MGACYVERTVKGGNEKYVIDRFKSMQRDAAYENGHSYSGDINMAYGIEFTNKVFKSHNDATEFLMYTCQKYDNALVCQYRNKQGQLVWLIGALCSS